MLCVVVLRCNLCCVWFVLSCMKWVACMWFVLVLHVEFCVVCVELCVFGLCCLYCSGVVQVVCMRFVLNVLCCLGVVCVELFVVCVVWVWFVFIVSRLY